MNEDTTTNTGSPEAEAGEGREHGTLEHGGGALAGGGLGTPGSTRRRFLLASGVLAAAAGPKREALAQGRDPRFGTPRSFGRNRYRIYQGNVPDTVLHVRSPDWLADECYHQRQDRAGANRSKVTFPEEVLGRAETPPGSGTWLYQPYIAGELDCGNHEPTHPSDVPPDGFPQAYSSLYSRFAKSIGWSFKPLMTSSNPPRFERPFDEFVAGLMERISRLNAAKYWLRLVHLRERKDQMLESQWQDLPDIPVRPPGGGSDGNRDTAAIYDLDGQTWEAAVVAAEEDFQQAADGVRTYIQTGARLGSGAERTFVYVDPVMCNDYVVGIRVVSDEGFDNDLGPVDKRQPGGSSSSYVRVSSPFSSYSA